MRSHGNPPRRRRKISPARFHKSCPLAFFVETWHIFSAKDALFSKIPIAWFAEKNRLAFKNPARLRFHRERICFHKTSKSSQKKKKSVIFASLVRLSIAAWDHLSILQSLDARSVQASSVDLTAPACSQRAQEGSFFKHGHCFSQSKCGFFL